MAANAAATLEGIYGQAKAAREAAAQSSRDQQLQSLAATYGRGIERVNTAADEAQRQNYITNQMQQRNLGQQLAAVGLNGGAAESTVLALNNQYGANRRQTEADRMGQIGDLQAEWAAQRAAAESQYNDQMAGIAADWASQLAAAKQAQMQRQAAALKTQYSNALGVPKAKEENYAEDLEAARIGQMSRSWVLAHADALQSEYGKDGYQYLLGAAYDMTPANQRVRDEVENAAKLEEERLRQQAIMQRIYK